MLNNALRMAKSTAKLLLRNKAFLVVGILIPLIATVCMNLWNNMDKQEKKDEVYELESMNTQIAYQVDFYRYPVKVYDKIYNEESKNFCDNLDAAGVFQIFRVDVSNVSEDEIMDSVKFTPKNDKVGAIIVLEDNFSDSTIYEIGEDDRFDLLVNSFELAVINHNAVSGDSVVTYVSVKSDDDIDYYETRTVGYCIAIATIAFVFGGVLVLGTILQENQDHVYSRILLTKANKASYLLSKIFLVIGTSLFQAIVMLLAFVLFVRADIGITVFQFFIVVFLEGLIFNLLSVCTGLFCKSMAGSAFLSFVIWSLSALLSGSYFDISGASETYRKVALLMPERWALFSVSRFQNGNSSGYSLMLCATLAYLVIIFVIGILGLKLNDEE
ncbi:MAG: ABC transporter permease [Clostridiales bacterium]|nr:ABC transporter permease [Candidatus Scatonaster coprocaballi]